MLVKGALGIYCGLFTHIRQKYFTVAGAVILKIMGKTRVYNHIKVKIKIVDAFMGQLFVYHIVDYIYMLPRSWRPCKVITPKQNWI